MGVVDNKVGGHSVNKLIEADPRVGWAVGEVEF